MRCDAPMPRVGFGQLKSFVGRSVIFVGRVESMEGGVVVMQAPDGSHVHVQASSSFDTPFVEVTGVVVDPQTIREESHVDYGDSFDLSLYNEFLKLSNGAHAELFQPRS